MPTLMNCADHDYLKFPVYTLTGCALILGLVESLVLRSRMEYVATLQSIATGRSKRSQRMRREKCECAKFRRKAHKLLGAVEEDLRQLLGVSVVRLSFELLETMSSSTVHRRAGRLAWNG